MKLSVIFTTYNSPAWLEKVLWGFSVQQHQDFEIIVADDGSGEETHEVIERAAQYMPAPVRHIWQEDQGFRKCQILNKAIQQAESDYLVFTDGDCIPRDDFLAAHAEHAEVGRFLSGGYYKLPMSTSEAISRDDVISGRAFELDWLKAHGLPSSYKTLKLTARGRKARWLNALTPTSPTWNGHSASGWKSDIVAVNGYDERMQWGGLDRELGERLENAGIRGKQIRYSAVCVHLDHGRGYVNPERVGFNRTLRDIVKKHKVTRTPCGIEHFEDPLQEEFEKLLRQRDLPLSLS